MIDLTKMDSNLFEPTLIATMTHLLLPQIQPEFSFVPFVHSVCFVFRLLLPHAVHNKSHGAQPGTKQKIFPCLSYIPCAS